MRRRSPRGSSDVDTVQSPSPLRAERRPTLISTLLKAGLYREVIDRLEAQRAGQPLDDGAARALVRAYWSLGMRVHAREALHSVRKSRRSDPELEKIRTEIQRSLPETPEGSMPAQTLTSENGPEHSPLADAAPPADASPLEGSASPADASPLEDAAPPADASPLEDAAPPADASPLVARIRELLQRGERRAAEALLAGASLAPSDATERAALEALQWGLERERTSRDEVAARVEVAAFDSPDAARLAPTVGLGALGPAARPDGPDDAGPEPGPVREAESRAGGEAVPAGIVMTDSAPLNGPEDTVALDENLQEPVPAPELEELLEAAEADEDDANPTDKLFVLPNGIGAVSLNIPTLRKRYAYGHEDDEVIVIEREGPSDVIKGETWFRGRAEPSWRNPTAGVPRVGAYGFDEDDVATEIAEFGPDGALLSRKHRKNLAHLEEDDEVIQPSERSLTPGSQPGPFALDAAENLEDAELDLLDGELEMLPPGATGLMLEEPAARLAPTAPEPLRHTAAPPFTQPPVPKLPSELSPGAPAEPVAPPPPPVRETPAYLRSIEISPPVPEDSAAGVARPAPALRAGRTPGGPGPGTARSSGITPMAGSPVLPSLSTIPAPARPAPRDQSTRQLALAAVGGLVLLVGGWAWSSARTQAHFDALETATREAITGGRREQLEAALQELAAGGRLPDTLSALEDVVLWRLWAEEGLGGSTPPSGAHLDGVTGASSLARVVARIERDLALGDRGAAEALLAEARVLHPGEAVWLELDARLALLDARTDSSRRSQARDGLLAALEKVRSGASLGFPVSEQRLLQQQALAETLVPGADVQAVLQAAVEQSPDSSWLKLRLQVASLPDGLAQSDYDDAIRQIEQSQVSQLSPRQRAWLMMTRARKAWAQGQIAATRLALAEATARDPAWVEPLGQLAQILLDQGAVRDAVKRLEAARKLAPGDLKLTALSVEALVEDTRIASASRLVDQIPAVSQEAPAARLAKGRILRARLSFDEANSQLQAGLQTAPTDFPLRLELARLLAARGDANAAKMMEELIPEALAAGRSPLALELEATVATLRSLSTRAPSFRAAVARSENQARSLAVLGRFAFERGDLALAGDLLKRAKSAGDLPMVDLLYAQLLAGDPASRSAAINLARSLVLSRCGEGTLCEQGDALLKSLQQ